MPLLGNLQPPPEPKMRTLKPGYKREVYISKISLITRRRGGRVVKAIECAFAAYPLFHNLWAWVRIPLTAKRFFAFLSTIQGCLFL